MLVFITSVRHPSNSKSYEKVEALLKKTLSSLVRQTNQDYRIIVVCNEIPSYASAFSNVDFLKVDFPPASKNKGSKVTSREAHGDRASKYFVALKKAEEYSPEYVMFFDADDLLSNKISQFVNSNPGENGFYMENGYVYGEGMITIKPKPNFHKACGSSLILSFELLKKIFGKAFNLPLNSSKEDIVSAFDEFIFYKILGNHSFTKEYLESIGFPLVPFPFPAAVWVVNTGENRSVTKGLSTVTGILVSRSHREEFMLDAPPLSPGNLIRHFSSFPIALFISLKLLIFRDMLGLFRSKCKAFFIKIHLLQA